MLIPFAIRQRRRLRESEAAFILLAAIAGIAAGVTTNLQQFLAHGMQQLFYGLSDNRLSAIGVIHHPWRLLALPFGGLLLVLVAFITRRRTRPPIDVVEANALHGGRIPFIDNLIVSTQTVISNGSGASVGLEAAYAQMGGGMASVLGQWLRLRRNDLRTLVGAGAGAAVGAAFGAPIAGAFYAFEIVIGTYTPAAIAPVLAAALTAVSVSRALGEEPYLLATTADRLLTTQDYFAYALLGLLCAMLGILVMRLVTGTEMRVSRSRLGRWRPVVGGLLLIPVCFLSPQSLSAGHGALHLNLLLNPSIGFLAFVLAMKIVACVISLSFGFRGGLFFASLFLGSVAGQIFADAANMLPLGLQLDRTDAALVGMAALSVSIVGGPMTLGMLILEATHDFALMGVVLTAALISGAWTRERFGYSFSTWRLHLRGSTVKSPRDVGRTLQLTAGRMMRRDWVAMPEADSVADMQSRVPLGSVSKVILTDPDGRYRGIVATAAAYRPGMDPAMPLSDLATRTGITLGPTTDVHAMLKLFDQAAVDEMAVVDDQGRVIGVVTERHARRRYLEEVEAAQREMFGES